MSVTIPLGGLPNETIFKRGDFNALSSFYTQMLYLNIVRDCAPVISEGRLSFRLYKSASDPVFLYQICIERDDRNKRFIYEVYDSGGHQIARDTTLQPVLKKFRYFLGDKHHIAAWKRPKRRTDEVD